MQIFRQSVLQKAVQRRLQWILTIIDVTHWQPQIAMDFGMHVQNRINGNSRPIRDKDVVLAMNTIQFIQKEDKHFIFTGKPMILTMPVF